MKKKKIIMPIPSDDLDPTEVSLSWKIVRDAGHEIEFATVDGKRGYTDSMMITGEGLDPWGWIPYINKVKLIGLFLRADRFGRRAYQEMERDSNFLNPKTYDALTVEQYDGMILPGGHAPLMKQYLEDKTLQGFVADFFDTVDSSGNHKPVAAICHGVVLAVRSISKNTNKSVLYGKKTTALTWALENSAWKLTKYFARYWDSTYYRTYMESSKEPSGHWGVENEIKRGLEKEAHFLNVPKGSKYYFLKTNGISRDRFNDSRPAWVVQDGNYISARWPGDVHTFAKAFVALLNES
jgi:putative intracellular protease/amidase